MNIFELVETSAKAGVFLSAEDGQLHFKLSVAEFPPELKAQIIANKQAIIDFLSKGIASSEDFVRPKINLVNRSEGQEFELSFAQQRLWFIDKMQNGSPEYNVPMVLRVSGGFDVELAQQSLARIIERHESLRTVFKETDNGVVQIINSSFDFSISRFDLSDLDKHQQSEQVEQLLALDNNKVFDLSQDLMIRAGFIQLSSKDEQGAGILMLNMHHIASDGWSKDRLNDEFMAIYQALAAGQDVCLPELEIQYVDFAVWQREWLADSVLEEQLRYWKQQLDQVPAVHSVPLDHPRPAEKSHIGAKVITQLDGQVSAALQQLANTHSVTPFMVVHGVLALLLSRHSDSKDIVIGSPVANRMQQELEPLIGFFVNTLVLRTQCDQSNLTELLAHVRQVNLDAQAHQDVPFEQLVEHCNVPRTMAHTPLFQIMLNMSGTAADSDAGQSVNSDAPFELSVLSSDLVAAKFDIELTVTLNSQGIQLSWGYDTTLFEPARIESISQHFNRLLTEVVQNPIKPLNELVMLSEQEQQHLLCQLNDNKVEYSSEQMIHQLFNRQVEQAPNAVAVVFEQQKLTYAQLNSRANQLAHYLKEQGVTTDTLVGIYAERSLEMVIAIWAILKAGGAYVPLEPGLPQNRLEYMVKDTGLTLILTQCALSEQLDWADDKTIVALDDSTLCAQLQTYSEQEPQTAKQTPASLAYVIYTSGSTGQPKGVMCTHQGLVNRIDWMQSQYQLGTDDKVLQKTPYSFDVSVWEFTWPVCFGGTLVVAKPDGHKDPVYLAQVINEQQISLLHFVPSMLDAMLQSGSWKQLHSVRDVFCSGEALSKELQDLFFSVVDADRGDNLCRLHNLYGPTEAAIDVSFWACQRDSSLDYVPIGRPIQNIDLLVLDQFGALVPKGAPGELYIGGVGLARGYLNLPELTTKQFITNPYEQISSERLYKSGDLVRMDAQGNICYLGRIDEQVKIRGLRIELGEIGHHLASCEGVSSSVVLVREDEPGQKRLVAYVTTQIQSAEHGSFITNIEHQLGQLLPEYMVPKAIVVLDALPLSANGKIDRKALPKPNEQDLQGKYVAPVTAKEKILVEIWSQLLKIDAASVSTHSNFFVLGGDSILSIQVVSRAAEQGLHFSVKDLFSAPTIYQLAIVAQDTAQGQVAYNPTTDEVKLSPVQYHFFSDEQDLHHFNQGLFLSIPADFNVEKLKAVAKALLQRHDALRLRFYREQSDWQSRLVPFTEQMLDAVVCVVEDMDTSSEQWLNYVNEQQRSFVLEQGPLFKAVYLPALSGDQSGQLLLLAHHLVVDGVSWRIILEDVARLFEQSKNEQPLELGAKTSSYQQWSEFVHDYANSAQLAKERDYWLDVGNSESQSIEQAKANQVPSEQPASQMGTAYFHLDTTLTTKLLTQSMKAYNSQINELLLAGVMLGLNRWGNINDIRLDMEGHGRETLTSRLDLSQTVGWFTTLYPLCLSVEQSDINTDEAIGCLINNVKTQYRSIPNNGIGFGMLKYLTEQDDIKAIETSELAFNYLGQFDNVTNDSNDFGGVKGPTGDSVSSKRKASHPLTLNGQIWGGKLGFELSYDCALYGEQAMKELMAAMADAMTAVVEHCSNIERGQYTPVDFPLAKVSEQELQLWAGDDSIVDLYPASGMQQGMLFHSLMEAGAYITQTELEFEALDVSAFRQAWDIIIERHVTFRTEFVGLNTGNPHQLVREKVTLPWHIEDLSGLDADAQAKRITELRLADKTRGFDPSKAPLTAMTLVNLGQQRHRLIWSNHHAIMDGWCTPIVFAEVTECYKAIRDGKQPQLNPAIPYRNYANWLASQDKDAAVEFWRSQLANVEGLTPVPLIESHKVVDTKVVDESGGVYLETLFFTKQETERLKQLAKSAQTTMNLVVQAGWSLLLSRYSGEEQVVFGTTISGRPAQVPGIETMIGLFINTVCVTAQIDENKKVVDWLNELHQNQIERESHSFLPLNDVQRLVQDNQSLFNTLLVFENFPVDETIAEQTQAADLAVKGVETFIETPYSVSLAASLTTHLEISIRTQKAQFGPQAVSQLCKHLRQLLLGFADVAAQGAVADIQMLSDSETDYLRHHLNDTQANYRQDLLIHQQFARQAQQTPDNIALVFEQNEITFGELNQRVNQFAQLLNEQCKGQKVIGLLLNRSFDTMTAIMAALQVGIAYVPIDASNPSQRIEAMVEDAQISSIFCHQDLSSQLGFFQGDILCVDDSQFKQRLESCDHEPVGAANNAKQDLPAYIIYTSGSTGKPKGVVNTHQNLAYFYTALQQQFDALELSHDCGWLWNASYAFDASLKGVVALSMGGKVVIPTDKQTKEPDELAQLLSQNQLQVFNAPPLLMEFVLPYLEKQQQSLNLMVSGDDVSNQLWNRLVMYSQQTGKKALNAYGPTETTVNATFGLIEQQDTVNIGHPAINTQAYVLGQQMQILPQGSVGELYVGGEGLAAGYLNKPEMSAERFVACPWDKEKVLFKTGDLVRYLPDGNMQFISRADHQVKHRGYRIELGEIESCLRTMAQVDEAVVITNQKSGVGQKLVAYLVLNTDTNVEQLNQFMAQTLPEYMIPTEIVFIDALPLTTGGKLDLGALRELGENSSLTMPATESATVAEEVSEEASGSESDTVEPSAQNGVELGSVEQQLGAIWCDVLQVDSVDSDDNFFARGGHSLVAMKMLSDIEKTFGVVMEIRDLMMNLTLASQAEFIESFLDADDSIDFDIIEDSDDTCDVEHQMRQIWCETLGLDSVELESDFFKLGGHSLLAMKLLNDIAQAFGVAMEIKDLLTHLTLEQQIAFVKSNCQSAQQQDDSQQSRIDQLADEIDQSDDVENLTL